MYRLSTITRPSLIRKAVDTVMRQIKIANCKCHLFPRDEWLHVSPQIRQVLTKVFAKSISARSTVASQMYQIRSSVTCNYYTHPNIQVRYFFHRIGWLKQFYTYEQPRCLHLDSCERWKIVKFNCKQEEEIFLYS